MFIYVYACVCVLMLVGRPEFDGLASLVALRAVLHFTVLRQINLYLSIYLSIYLSLSLSLSLLDGLITTETVFTVLAFVFGVFALCISVLP